MRRAAAALLWSALLSAAIQIVAPRASFAAQSTQQAADSALEARTREVASQLRCPVCQGLSIQDSPSELAQQMRSLVRDQLRAGKTPDEVKRYFVGRYGQFILLEPEPSGINVLVYLLPALAVIGGAAVIFFAVRRWTRPPTNRSDADPLSEIGR